MSLVVQSGSKQYVLELGQKFLVDRLVAEPSSVIELELIHSFGSDAEIKSVKATVLRHLKGEKIRVVKFKSKSNYHRQYGHRSYLTELQVEGGVNIEPSKTTEPTQTELTKSEEKPKKTTKKVETVDKVEKATKTTKSKKTETK